MKERQKERKKERKKSGGAGAAASDQSIAIVSTGTRKYEHRHGTSVYKSLE